MPSSHSNTPSILVYGQDDVLLYTRGAILRAAEMQAETTQTRREFVKQIAMAENPYDLYVLCHSISAAEQREICALAANTRVKVYPMSYAVTPTEFIESVRTLLSIT